MNCQPEYENNSQLPAACAEQQPMEVLDYLRLASFIRYLRNDSEEGDAAQSKPSTALQA